MSEPAVSAALRRLVEERAARCCEYGLLPADVAFFPHEIDHVIALKHGGTTAAANLALACWRCNRHKRGALCRAAAPDRGREAAPPAGRPAVIAAPAHA